MHLIITQTIPKLQQQSVNKELLEQNMYLEQTFTVTKNVAINKQGTCLFMKGQGPMLAEEGVFLVLPSESQHFLSQQGKCLSCTSMTGQKENRDTGNLFKKFFLIFIYLFEKQRRDREISLPPASSLHKCSYLPGLSCLRELGIYTRSPT